MYRRIILVENRI